MKKVLTSLVAILLPAIALAQNPPFIIQTPGATVNNGTMAGFSGSALTNGKGELFINSLGTPIPVSGTVTTNPSGTPIVVQAIQTPVSLAGAELTPVAMITIIPTAVPTAYGTPQFANSAALKTVTVDNSTGNVEIWCAYDGLTATSLRVPAGSVYTDNLFAHGNVMSGPVGCIHPAATPATGTISIYGGK